MRAEGGNEIAVLGFDKIDRPKDDGRRRCSRARGCRRSTRPSGSRRRRRSTLPSARAVAVYYGDGDQLLVATAPPTGRWTLGDWTVVVGRQDDRQADEGQRRRCGAPRIELTLDEGRVVPPRTDGVHGDVDRRSAARRRARRSAATKIAVPESGQAAQATRRASRRAARASRSRPRSIRARRTPRRRSTSPTRRPARSSTC